MVRNPLTIRFLLTLILPSACNLIRTMNVPQVLIFKGLVFDSKINIQCVLLAVLSRELQPPKEGNSTIHYGSDNVFEIEERTDPSDLLSHNYTDCCYAFNVSTKCLGFCTIQNILEGNTGQDPEQCEADFPSIVRCMAGKLVTERLNIVYNFRAPVHSVLMEPYRVSWKALAKETAFSNKTRFSKIAWIIIRRRML